MVRGFLFKRATGGAVASPFEGGLGGSAPLLVRFLGASEKMNRSFCFFPKRRQGNALQFGPFSCRVIVFLMPLRKFAEPLSQRDFGRKSKIPL